MTMRRRDFITLLGGAAAGWPLAARAQQTERVRHIGMLLGGTDDQVTQTRLTALRQGLEGLGWIEGRNVRIDIRFGEGDPNRFRAYAKELISLASEVIVTGSAQATRAVQQQTQTIPIVITGVGDPVTNGIVKSLAHPEGNVTGVTNLYLSIGGRWLQLLKEAVPNVETVGLVYNARVLPNDTNYGYFPTIDEAAGTLAVQVTRIGYSDAVDLVHAIDEFSTRPNGGLIVMPPAPNAANREVVRRLAAQHRLPAMYHSKEFAAEGGLMSYGSDPVDQYRRASSFVDRILRGAKVSNLPVEFPTKFELTINLKTAKVIGLTIPEAFLARADELIE
jgi:putative ABC transport system substrate-binding protein